MTTLALLDAKIRGSTAFSRGTLKRLKQRDRLWVLPLAGLGVLGGGAGFLAMLVQNYLLLYRLGASAGHPGLVLSVGLALGWVFVFAVVFPLAMSALYFSRDNLLLLALPVPPARIVGANLALLYLYGLPVLLLVFVPALAVYFAGEGVTAGALGGALVLVLAGGLVPLGLGVLAVLGVTALAPVGRYRMALEVAGMALLVVGLVALQGLLSRAVVGQSIRPDAVGQALQGLMRALLAARRLLPPLAWAERGVAGGGDLTALGAFLGLSGGWAAAVLAICQAGWVRQVQRRQEHGAARRGPVPARQGQGLRRSRPPWRALLSRELGVLFSNSSFAFEAAGEVLILPILLAVFAFMIPAQLREELLPAVRGSPFTVPAAGTLLALFAGFNTVCPTSLSREGRLFALSLSLPLRGRDHLRGKLACFLLLFYPAYAVNACILAALLSLRPLELIALLPTGLALLCLLFAAGVYTDLRRPLLVWNHPQQAMKQNLNVLLSMGLALCLLLPLAAAQVALLLLGLSAPLAVLAEGALAATAALVLYPRLARYADRRYAAAMGA